MKVKLESFLQEISEKTTENDQHPVLTSSKAGLFLQRDYFNKQVASKDNTGYKIIRRGQFTYRAMSDTGEFFPNMLECTDIGIVSPAYPVFEITKQDIVIPEFLKYFFKSDSFQHSIAAFAQGSTRTSVKFGKMKTVEITLPSVPEQRHIVEVLDRAKTVIEVREQELQKLDELVNARFVELFGGKDYPSIPLIDTVKEGAGLSYGIVVPGENVENGIPMVRPSDFKNGKLDLLNVYRVAADIEEKYAKTRLIGDEILVQVIGQPGQVMLATNECKGMNVTRNLAVIRPNHEIINRIYLKEFIEKEDSQQILLKNTKQSTLKQLPLNLLKQLEVQVPPMELQNEFADFVEQIDKSKAAIQKALEEAQTLFDSLMQQYFG